jgi:SAM-dependent methyltransferase
MSVKRRARAYASPLLDRPPVRRLLEAVPVARNLYSGWSRTHPFDRSYGTDTSGFVPPERMGLDPALSRHMMPYAGSQPSIVRRAIAALPEQEGYCFVDLGCGKARPLLIASEFPFRRLVGVELSPDLANIARANAARIRRDFPGRPAIDIVEGDASRFMLPSGNIVLFVYHAFDADFVRLLVKNLEDGLSGPLEHLFVIYYNPVLGAELDASPALTRWYAETLPYDSSELGFGPDREDTVVIWQSRRGAAARAHAQSDRRIVPGKTKVSLAA